MTSVDNNTGQMINFDVVEHRTYPKISSLIKRIHNEGKNVTNYHSDDMGSYKTYAKYHKDLNWTFTKDKTTMVESVNSILRGYIAPLVRRTKCVTHSLKALYNKIWLLFYYRNKNIKNFVDFLKFNSIFVPVFP